MSGYEHLVVLAFSAILAHAITPRVAEAMSALNHVRPDVHKPGRPLVPYSGGIAIYASTMLALLAAALFDTSLAAQICVLAAVASIAFAVGLVDDFKVLGGRTKTLLTLLTVLPLVVAHITLPSHVQLGRPLVPLLGRLRLTIVYWLLLPLVAAGPANVVNMLDVFNGVMPATSLAATIALVVSAYLIEPRGALLLLPLLGALAGYLPYNKWPARVLNGDSGSLMVGAYIGAVAALLHLEFIAAVTLIPHILNGALVIASVGGFKEHRQMRERPVLVREDFKLVASSSQTAPISLVRLILAVEGPLEERQVAVRLIALGIVSSILAVVSALLTPR